MRLTDAERIALLDPSIKIFDDDEPEDPRAARPAPVVDPSGLPYLLSPEQAAGAWGALSGPSTPAPSGGSSPEPFVRGGGCRSTVTASWPALRGPPKTRPGAGGGDDRQGSAPPQRRLGVRHSVRAACAPGQAWVRRT